MIQSKTIILEDSCELHIDPVGDQIELAVKLRSRFGLNELSRIRLSREKRLELVAALMGLDATVEQREAA